MPVHFEEAPDSPGFDDSMDKDSPWLIVPTGGSRKVRLVESAGYDNFDYDKSQISIHVSPGPDRLIEVVAKNGGIAHLCAKNKRGDGPNLQIRILDKQQVKLAFFLVTDTKNRLNRRPVASLQQLLKDVNQILLPQTNVEVVPGNHPKPVHFDRDLGPVIDGKDPLRRELTEITGTQAVGADVTVFFVWDLAGGENGGLSFTQERFLLMKDQFVAANKDGQVLAHEIGHYLLPMAVWKNLGLQGGHSSDPSDLMYAYYDVAGTKIPYLQALTMNQEAAKP